MPDDRHSLSWRKAALELETRLRATMGQAPERLDEAKTRDCYPRRNWVAAWRIRVNFSDNIERRIDIVATAGFPTIPVRTSLVDHPEFMTWPHVESDGTLCLLPNLAERDPDDPTDVAINLLNRSVRLIEELLDGGIIDRDFREEFLTYWAYKADLDGSRLFSLLAPEPPSRTVYIWRGDNIEVVGENAEMLHDWVQNRFGYRAKAKVEPAVFIWLEEAPLPSAYPETASELRNLAISSGSEAVRALDEAAFSEPDQILAVLGAEGRGGPGLVGVKVPKPKQFRPRSGFVSEPLSKGFRPGHTPESLLVERFFGPKRVIRSQIQRADAHWIHGRGRDPRTTHLLGKTLIVVGCGSVGAPVVCNLVQAGIGHIILVDHDSLSWPNIGRHPLGASAVGRNKAEAFAERLQVDYPHLRIESRPCNLLELLHTDPSLLEKADLIVSATGSWAAEHALNRWHIDHGRRNPIIYAWTEAHACAGHGVVIAAGEGCLQCHIGRTGTPDFKVVEWSDGSDANQEEPACGAHYQPYGPVELARLTVMIAEMALDCLLDPPTRSFNRMSVTSYDRIVKLGGQLSEAMKSSFGNTAPNGQVMDRDWPPTNCPACARPKEIDIE